ncbi:molybdate ABC transporter substrate-binding protein [Falsiroseomonas sp. HW251]|uniref:molybdate ABC transporter substrate-binding protein n=1 Tax=Falsiroseomonas sp. HW251 TaxID=3390998 RepID=UPI003D319F05
MDTDRRAILAAALALPAIASGRAARAGGIRLLCAVALRPAMGVLLADFAGAAGQEAAIAFDTAGAVANRVRDGEAADVLISSTPLMQQLQAQGRIAPGDLVVFARVGVGAFVRPGAAKPDIGSAAAFTRAMLAARSIAYPDPAGGGASGIYLAALLERLGIAEAMRPRTRLLPPTEVLYDSVAGGEVEIGFNQVSEILAQPSVEFAGPLPPEIQNYTRFAGGIVTGSAEAEAGRALVAFLASPPAQAVLRAKGFE